MCFDDQTHIKIYRIFLRTSRRILCSFLALKVEGLIYMQVWNLPPAVVKFDIHAYICTVTLTVQWARQAGMCYRWLLMTPVLLVQQRPALSVLLICSSHLFIHHCSMCWPIRYWPAPAGRHLTLFSRWSRHSLHAQVRASTSCGSPYMWKYTVVK